MYRLLQVSGSSIRLFQLPSFKNICENVEVSSSRCQSCGIVIKSVRNQSTKPNIECPPKKRKKRNSKFAEIVVVTENSSSQQRASVQKLTSNDLKLLATTNFNLGELYKLKTLPKYITHVGEHTFNNLNFLGSLPNVPVSMELPIIKPMLQIKDNDDRYLVEVKNEEIVENEESVDSRILENVFQAALTEEEEEHHEEPVKKQPYEKKNYNYAYAEEITSKTLAAYGDICSVLKNPQRGLNALYYSKSRKLPKSKPLVIKNVNVYNSVLKGFAQKGDYSKIREVINLMKEANVSLNVQSHIYVLECLGRINIKDSRLMEIHSCVKEMLENRISFDQIMNEGAFFEGQRDMVLKAMHAHSPSYKPKYLKPNLQYSNHLVNHLNNDEKDHLTCCEVKNGLFTKENLVEATKKQLELEKIGYVMVKSIENKGPISEEVLRYRKILQEHYISWEKDATKAFNRDLSALSAKRSALNMEPYLRCIPVKDFVSIIVEEAKKMSQGSETYSPTVTMLYRELGNKVYTRYRVLNKEKTGVLNKIYQIHSSYCKQYTALHTELDVLPCGEVNSNTRQMWQKLEHSLKKSGATLSMDHQEWVPTTLKFIGKFLYHIVMHDLKVDVNSMKNLPNKNFIPAFYTIFRTQNRIAKEEVKPHPVLSKLYRESVSEYLTFPTYELPMICPPLPWSSVNNGGYLISPSDLVRLPFQANSQKMKMSEINVQKIYPSLDALNQLSAVPWKVNQRILDVILEVFSQGGSASLDVPESPTTLPPPPSPTPEMDKSDRFQLFRQKMQYRRKKGEMYSLWCDCLYRLSLANHFRNDTFWLPHNMDFRGRVYPIPPHLSHMGSDLARSILVFAEARPLGPEGMRWLKLHLVNLTGLKKRDSIVERLKFAEESIDLILDSADNPLTGKRWWTKSDEPWQTLACCMEVANAIRSPDPEKYCSHFPIHQDGSCNGLQHYAALGRDTAGAVSVNLAPCGEPQDVYSAVAALVEQQRAKDEAAGVEVAKVLKGFVKRKVIKQTVMTTVYGVTRYGAKLQIAKQLKDINDFPKDYVWLASSYLTARTFDSIASMFTSTREIQDWFTECARLISQVGGQRVEWVTPLGLPIVQPYFKLKNITSPVCEAYPIDKYEKPNVMKQKNAFPPNFIHSLDSSHMMLTSLYCERAGITFVSVHDCYWTHPSTTNIMNKICREQFVALHSEPILDDLSEFMVEKYSYQRSDFTDDGSVSDLTKKKLNRILRQLPKTGDFDIKQVLQSTYFFS